MDREMEHPTWKESEILGFFWGPERALKSDLIVTLVVELEKDTRFSQRCIANK